MSKISIIIVCLNDLPNLKITLKALEDYVNSELIVIDGCSSDGTIEFLKTINRPNLRYTSETDTGIYNAMNKGIRLATGEYCWFINAGDFPAAVETRIVGDLEDNSGGSLSYGVKINTGIDWVAYYGRLTRPHQGMVYRKSHLIDFGMFDESYRIISDRIMYDKFEKKINFKKINDVICFFEPNGLSSSKRGRSILIKEGFYYFLQKPNFKNILRLLSSFKIRILQN